MSALMRLCTLCHKIQLDIKFEVKIKQNNVLHHFVFTDLLCLPNTSLYDIYIDVQNLIFCDGLILPTRRSWTC